jgi:hypothetical protein
VFGDALAALPADPPASRAAADRSHRADLESRAAAALGAHDYSTLTALTEQLAKLAAGPATPLPRLRLQRMGAPDTLLTAEQSSLSQYHAEFSLPHDIPAGEYSMSIASEAVGDGWVAVDFFESPSQPHVRTLSVRKPVASPSGVNASQSFQMDTVCEAVPAQVFRVADFGPTRLPAEAHHAGTLALTAVDATAALTKALAAAKSHGGGTVFFPRGQYFLSGTFEIPTNTYLKGAGTSLVSLYWAEANHTVHPRVL